jgi:hypothetical protein
MGMGMGMGSRGSGLDTPFSALAVVHSTYDRPRGHNPPRASRRLREAWRRLQQLQLLHPLHPHRLRHLHAAGPAVVPPPL